MTRTLLYADASKNKPRNRTSFYGLLRRIVRRVNWSAPVEWARTLYRYLDERFNLFWIAALLIGAAFWFGVGWFVANLWRS
jgi:hypothetical protein